MTDAFAMFEDDRPDTTTPKPMSDAQRQTLRDLFAALNVSDARAQFDLVEEMTGRRPGSVRDIDENAARSLIIQVRHRVSTAGRGGTGNRWTDRVEDTWIDKL